MPLDDFLVARTTDDENAAFAGDMDDSAVFSKVRVLAECNARRELVADYRAAEEAFTGRDGEMWHLSVLYRHLLLFALAHAKHPDFDIAWLTVPSNRYRPRQSHESLSAEDQAEMVDSAVGDAHGTPLVVPVVHWVSFTGAPVAYCGEAMQVPGGHPWSVLFAQVTCTKCLEGTRKRPVSSGSDDDSLLPAN
jgi:hypothetical protein